MKVLQELMLRLKSMNHPCSTSIYPCTLVTVSMGEKVKKNYLSFAHAPKLMCFIQYTSIFDPMKNGDPDKNDDPEKNGDPEKNSDPEKSGDPKKSGDPEMRCNPDLLGNPCLMCDPCLVCNPCDLEPGWGPEKNCDDQGSRSDPCLLLRYFGMDEIYWFGEWFEEMSGIE